MDDKNSTRIQGTVTDFNGIVGRASGPDGGAYAIHISNFEPEWPRNCSDRIPLSNFPSLAPLYAA